MDVGEVMLAKKYVGEKRYVGEKFRYVGEMYVGECSNLDVCWWTMLVKKLIMLANNLCTLVKENGMLVKNLCMFVNWVI